MKSAILRAPWFLGLLAAAVTLHAQVVISEFMANNRSTLADQDGEFSDWIEIHNSGGTTVNLAGWSLTDSPNQLAKWRFPGVTLGPNAYLTVFASGKDRAVVGAQLHANFSLNAEGDYLALVRPDTTTIASDFGSSYGEQFSDVSYGRFQGANYYFARPTPGTANGSTGFIAAVADTKFSQDRGFYDTAFDLTIRTATADAVIRYTTDGLPPTETTGIVYSSPIRIAGTATVRAAAFKTGYLPSNVDTHTYVFLDDVIGQSPTGQPPPGWPSSWGSNVRDYGMDPDVVNNPLYSGTIKNDLKTLPSFSIVMDVKDLFDPARGIYANPGQDGRDWERPASVELIYPDGRPGFQINAGLRIRGGFSRSTSNPKHAFRLLFRDDYGAPKLKFPLFGDAGADTFDNMDLRTFQNYSWSFQNDARGVFLRDQFSRDLQLAMGHQGERGDFYHLYINGQYWGLYNTCERPEASFGETYFGGKKDDYDVVKVEAGSYALLATDGNMSAWTRLYNLAKAGLDTTAAYQQIQGNNPDGTRNPSYEVLIDIPNLIDYMLVIFYGGNLDAPISNFLNNTSPNNWYGVRNRNGTEGFRFFVHDAEHTLLDLNQDRTGPFPAGDTSVTKSSPQYIWKRLQANPEFRLRVADHIHRHFFNGGLLTPANLRTRFLARKAEIDRAVVGESARWGDAKRSTPLTRTDWLNAINNIVNNYLPRRSDIVLTQLKGDSFYPNLTAPSFNQHGGNIVRGFTLTMAAPSGTIYYTRDGSDPRLLGGAVASGARAYSGALTLNESSNVKARVLSGGEWSALNEATFTVIQNFSELVISEIMYNPPGLDGVDGDEFEFIELKNISNAELDLSGVHFTNGVAFTFPLGTKLSPGQMAVLVGNPAEFQKKYPGVQVAGRYTGRLSNGGESVTLVHAVGTPITSVTFSDQSPWPTTPDGDGFSLAAINPNLKVDGNDPANWRASTRPGGSPVADDPPAAVVPVIVNEILTHTDPPLKDSVELHNPNTGYADLSNWYLTDSRSAPKKFHIPSGTTIPPNGYLVFTEDQFNPSPGTEPSFNFSSHGEEVFLFSADAAGNLTGYSDGFSFGAGLNGVSFGRFTNSVGEILYPVQSATTLGSVNGGPRIGPIVIDEIQYQPAIGGDEFVELRNISNQAVKLYDPAHPANSWRLNGVGFDFPANTEIPANGLVLVVGTDPSFFRSKYQVPEDVAVFGPFSGTLQDSGELLQLQRPDEPDVDSTGAVVVPYLEVDSVRYNDRAPWPTGAAGLGSALERIDARAYGNDPSNWRASPGPPSPGLLNGGNRGPQVNAGSDLRLEAQAFPLWADLSGLATDDGLPNPPNSLSVGWTQVSGPGDVVFTNPNQLKLSASFPGIGTYVLRLTASDGTLTASDEIAVTIERPPLEATLVPAGSVWRYLDNGSDQGTAWRGPTFNDSSWPSGRAELGYGDTDVVTVIQTGPTSNKYVTSYFRRTFPVANAATVSKLTVRLVRDDGAVVYLNGREVFRSNLPEGTIDYRTYASAVVGDADESTFFERDVDPSLLVEGNNTLAVELHQVNATSSDLGFNLELKAMMSPTNLAPQANAGPDQTIAASAEATLKGVAADDGLPIPPGRLTISWSQVSGPDSVTFSNPNAVLTTASFRAAGIYMLRFAVTDGELVAQDDLTVTVENGGAAAWKAQYFTPAELTNPAIGGDDADPDGDGHTNLEEFNAGTHPREVASVLKFLSVQSDSNGTKLQFKAEAGKTYTIQFVEGFGVGAWRRLADVPAREVSQIVEVTDSESPRADTRYYRIVTPQSP